MSVYFWRSGGLSLSPRAFFFSSFRFLRLSIVDMCCFRFSTHLHLPFNQLAEASFVRFYRRCHSSRKKKKTFKFFFPRNGVLLSDWTIYLRFFSFFLSLFARDHLDTLSKKNLQVQHCTVRTVILLLSIANSRDTSIEWKITQMEIDTFSNSIESTVTFCFVSFHLSLAFCVSLVFCYFVPLMFIICWCGRPAQEWKNERKTVEISSEERLQQ